VYTTLLSQKLQESYSFRKMNRITEELKKERRDVFDTWMDIECKLDVSSRSLSDVRADFGRLYPEYQDHFDNLMRSYLTRHAGKLSLDKFNNRIYFNKAGDNPSRFRFKSERNQKRKHEKTLRESKKTYEQEKAEWYYSQYQENGECPPAYPTFESIRLDSVKDKYNQEHYQPPEKARNMEPSTRYTY